MTFLSWAAEPEMEERKLVIMTVLSLHQSTVYAHRKDHISGFFFSFLKVKIITKIISTG